MSAPPHPNSFVSPGGSSLTASLAALMNEKVFAASLWCRMSYAERQRLYALHQQACFGDAPPAATTSPFNTAAAVEDNLSHLFVKLGLPTLAWFDFSARARRRQWESLRGTMSGATAAEAFCAEFIALVKKYRALRLVPHLEAALSQAQRLNEEEAIATSQAPEEKFAASEEKLVFCVRAYECDPAALAMNWLCTSFAIPLQLTIEPLRQSALVGAMVEKADPCEQVLRGVGADAPFYAGVRRGRRDTFLAEVSGPEAAFQLLVDVFLAHMPHWAGAGGETAVPTARESVERKEGSQTVISTSPTQCASGRTEHSVWLHRLQCISKHLRAPIMSLMLHAVYCSCNPSEAAAATAPRRQQLRAAVAGHLLVYQQQFVREELRHLEAQSRYHVRPTAPERAVVIPHLIESKAATALVFRAFSNRLVSCVDVYAACCGYVLCTNPFVCDLFPVPSAAPLVKDATAAPTVGAMASWPGQLSAVSAKPVCIATGERQQGVPPPSSPSVGDQRAPLGGVVVACAFPHPAVHLAGVSKAINDALNSVLQEEAALAQAQLLGRRHGETRSGRGVTPPASAATAAEAVERLISARLLQCNSPELDPEDSRNVALSPFAVLANLLARSWALSVDQLPPFPFLGAAEASRCVRFLPCERKLAATASVGPTEAFHIIKGRAEPSSMERMLTAGWAVVRHVVAGHAGLEKMDCAASPITCRSEEPAITTAGETAAVRSKL